MRLSIARNSNDNERNGNNNCRILHCASESKWNYVRSRVGRRALSFRFRRFVSFRCHWVLPHFSASHKMIERMLALFALLFVLCNVTTATDYPKVQVLAFEMSKWPVCVRASVLLCIFVRASVGMCVRVRSRSSNSFVIIANNLGVSRVEDFL